MPRSRSAIGLTECVPQSFSDEDSAHASQLFRKPTWGRCQAFIAGPVIPDRRAWPVRSLSLRWLKFFSSLALKMPSGPFSGGGKMKKMGSDARADRHSLSRVRAL